MNKPIQIWMPECWMENHREQEHTDALRLALRIERVYVVDEKDIHAVADCDVVFLGSWKYYDMATDVRRVYPDKPVVHYNWDIYPFQVNERTNPVTDRRRQSRPTANACRWREYIEELKHATEVWVPSQGVVNRTHQFCGEQIRCEVVKCNAFVWGMDDRKMGWWTTLGVDLSKPYVVDVMRQYPDEPMVGAVKRACDKLGIPCVQTDHRLTWDEFRCLIKNASLLVSAYNEASTGGLTLLEGYAHGVPVLISDSPYQGANDYFKVWGYKFQAGNEDDLTSSIKFIMGTEGASGRPEQKVVDQRREWVQRHYSVEAFARRLAAGFRRVLDGYVPQR